MKMHTDSQIFWTSDYNPNPGPEGTGPVGTNWVVEMSDDPDILFLIRPMRYTFTKAAIRLVQDIEPK